MQIKIPVHKSHPLTHSNNGIEVWVILDEDDGPAGVYPSPERAIQYIEEWLAACEDPRIRITSIEHVNEEFIRVQSNNQIYEIRRTEFRL